MIKRKIKILTVLLIIASSMSIFAACTAESHAAYTTELHTELLYDLSQYESHYIVTGIDLGRETDITIPAEHNGLPVKEIGSNAFYNCTSLTNITIPNSVKWIENHAFTDCTSLKNVYIPDSVTDIGASAFSNCTSLTSITIPNSINRIENHAFARCTSLTSVSIPNSVTSIGYYAFYNCTSLTSVSIPDSVTDIEYYAFCNCACLKNISMPDSITNIDRNVFYGCISLTSLIIPDSVHYIGDYAFINCCSLTLYIESPTKPKYWDKHWNYGNNPVIWNCNKNDKDENGNIWAIIDDVRYSLNDGKASIARQPKNRIDKVFTIPANVTYNNINYDVTYIESSAFHGWTALESITIPSRITSINSRVFYGCSSLKSITIPSSVTWIGDEAFGNCESLTNIAIPNSVTSIGFGAFSNCTSLKSVYIPDSVIGISSNAFLNCPHLTIYAEHKSKPSVWSLNWNDNRPVVWDYKNTKKN